MQIVTRRNALRATGFAAIAPLFGVHRADSSVLSPLQTSGNSNTASASAPYNFQLHAFAQDSIASLSAKFRSRSAHVEDFAQAASAVHQYGAHIEKLNFDLVAPYLAKKMVPSTSDHVDQVHTAFRKYEPSYPREKVEADLKAADAQIGAVQASLTKHGLSWHFYSAAQSLRLAQKVTAIEHADSASCNCGKDGKPTNAIYPRHSHYKNDGLYHATRYRWPQAHFQTVALSAPCKKLLCRALNGVLGTVVTNTLIKAFTGLTADAFCDIDLVVSILGDVGTDGVASIASPLEAALCAAAQAAAASGGGVLTASALGGVIGGSIGDVQTGLGCPV